MSIRAKTVITVILAIGVVLYPILVYFGTGFISLRIISLLIGTCLILSLFLQRNRPPQLHLLLPIILGVILCLTGAFMNYPSLTLYLPVLFSVGFFISFAYTLLFPPSMVEIFARMIIPERSPDEIAYCRRITIVWVIFFGLNGSVAFFTACCASIAAWSLYNGLLSYVVIGIIFAVELCYRYWRFRRYAGLPTDFIFKKIFPPRR